MGIPNPSLRLLLRGVFATILLLSVTVVVGAYVTDEVDQSAGAAFQVGEQAVEPRPHGTVITTSQHQRNFLVSFAPNGTVTYYDDRYSIYDDVDPLGEQKVLYVAHQRNLDECPPTSRCNLNVVETVNLTTGERTRLYSRMTPVSQNHWHDVDRLGPHRLLVADIAYDRVFIVNTTTDVVTWTWNAQDEYSIESGGIYPGDWTHLNDVEMLPDGRVMVSLRNQDQVVFINRTTGLNESWTLGSDGDHSVLFAQHNPDYIPADRGGPAVVAADSENGRLVEYQRRNGSWHRTWAWSDPQLQWPRDADRLPSGNTLVADSNGGRVLEVNESGAVVWSVEIRGSYDAERLGTGPESATGRSATALGLESRDATAGGGYEASPGERTLERVESAMPSLVVNGLLYVLPEWAGLPALAAVIVGGTTLLAWGAAEFYWSAWSLRPPVARSSADEEAVDTPESSGGRPERDDD